MQKLEQLIMQIEKQNEDREVDYEISTKLWEEMRHEILILLLQPDVSGRSEQLPQGEVETTYRCSICGNEAEYCIC